MPNWAMAADPIWDSASAQLRTELHSVAVRLVEGIDSLQSAVALLLNAFH